MSRSAGKRVKSVLGWAAGLSGIYSYRFRSAMTIVAFHRVNDSMAEDGLTCSAAKFAAFCKFFQRHFRVLPLSEQVAGCHAGRDMGGTLSITFDDGYLDNCVVAAPILRRLGLPATFFVTSGYIGSNTVASWDADLASPAGWMNWEHVRELAAQGFEIGSHTDTHIDMGTASAELVRAELNTSRQVIRRETGVDVRLFAYPFGGQENLSMQSRELVRELGFTCCASCYGGINPPVADPYSLKRIGIAEWFGTPDQFGFELSMNKTELPPGSVNYS